MKTLDKEYLGWDTDSHVQAFDLWNKKSNFEFNFTYGNFAEQRYLLNHVKSNKGSSILDVGCASATSYRFLKNNLSFQVFHDTKIQGNHFIKKKWLHSFCFKVLHKLLKK